MGILDNQELQDYFIEGDPLKPLNEGIAREPFVGTWREFDREGDHPFATLKDLKEVADKVEWDKGFASNVVSRIYYFNSKVFIYQNNEGGILLVLPDAEVVIDLFNPTANFFLGNNNVSIEDCVKDILCLIGCDGYHFFFLREAYEAINVISNIPRLPQKKIKKGDVIFQGTSYLGNDASESFLNYLLQGNYNWTSNSKRNLEYSLYPYNVICYENLSYIKEEKDYCIDTFMTLNESKIDLDNYLDNRQIVLLSLFSSDNPSAKKWTGETSIKFLGMYWLDKKKSIEEDHIVFKNANQPFWIP